jgi:hypothetical protein
LLFAQLRDELRAWLLAAPVRPKPVLCYDFQGDSDLLDHLLEGRLPRGRKHENVAQKIDVQRLTEYIAEHGGNIMRCMTPAQMRSLSLAQLRRPLERKGQQNIVQNGLCHLPGTPHFLRGPRLP